MSGAGSAPVFSDGKEPDALRTIGEVAEGFGLKTHILRYWEEQFPALRPLKRSGGRRLYRAEDVALVARIDALVNTQGYTLKGAKAVLGGETGSLADARAGENLPRLSSGAGAGAGDPVDVVAQLRAIRSRLAAALEG